MIIAEDTKQKEGKHEELKKYLRNKGISKIERSLSIGDYMFCNEEVIELFKQHDFGTPITGDALLPYMKVAVDTKKDITELYSNMSGDQDRVKRECKKALDNNIPFYFLIVDEDVHCIDDLENHKYEHCKSSNPGAYLKRCCEYFEKTYNVDFIFCTKKELPKTLIALLISYNDEDYDGYLNTLRNGHDIVNFEDCEYEIDGDQYCFNLEIEDDNQYYLDLNDDYDYEKEIEDDNQYYLDLNDDYDYEKEIIEFNYDYEKEIGIEHNNIEVLEFSDDNNDDDDYKYDYYDEYDDLNDGVIYFTADQLLYHSIDITYGKI